MKMNLKAISRWRTELMGIAAIWILYFHIGGEPLFSQNEFLSYIGTFISKAGYYGVDIFLFLSGMGVFYALHNKKEGIGQFYKRRFIRVYPAFFILFLYAYLSPLGPFQLGEFVKNITLYTNWKYNLYSGGWYVAAILAFYLVTPFYYKIFEKVKYKTIFTAIVSVSTVALVPLYEHANRMDLKAVVQRIPIYLVGILIGSILSGKKDDDVKDIRCVLVWVAFLIGGALSYIFVVSPVYSRYSSYPGIIFIPAFCIIVSNFMDKLKMLFQSKKIFGGLQFIGSCSLEFYLLQEPAVGFRNLVEQVMPFGYLPDSDIHRCLAFFVRLLLFAAVANLIHRIVGEFINE